MGRARGPADEMTDDRFAAIVGSRRGDGTGLDLLGVTLSESMRAVVNDAIMDLVRNQRQPALDLLTRAPREAARSPHLAALIGELARDAVVRVGVDEWELAEEAGWELLDLTSAKTARFTDLAPAQQAVNDLCLRSLRMALASGWEPEGPGLDKLAVAAWREHVCQIIADTILPHGFKSLQLLVDGGNTRNLAGWVRRRNPDVTRPDSQRLRVKLVTAAALAPAYKYLADAKERIRGRALSDEALAQASDKRKFHLQMLIYTGMRRELGDNLPLPPLPPA